MYTKQPDGGHHWSLLGASVANYALLTKIVEEGKEETSNERVADVLVRTNHKDTKSRRRNKNG